MLEQNRKVPRQKNKVWVPFYPGDVAFCFLCEACPAFGAGEVWALLGGCCVERFRELAWHGRSYQILQGHIPAVKTCKTNLKCDSLA